MLAQAANHDPKSDGKRFAYVANVWEAEGVRTGHPLNRPDDGWGEGAIGASGPDIIKGRD